MLRNVLPSLSSTIISLFKETPRWRPSSPCPN